MKATQLSELNFHSRLFLSTGVGYSVRMICDEDGCLPLRVTMSWKDRQVIRADSHREALSWRSIFETEDPGAQYCLTGTESAII